MRARVVPALAVLLLILTPNRAAAQRQDADSTALDSLPKRDTTPHRLGRVLITGARARYAPTLSSTATKTETLLRDTPQAVSVVTRELIADQAMQGMADVVRYVPGASMALGEGHRDAVTIRGNASTADFFSDGVRDDAQYLRDLYNVERVEALKGSNAMVFGRGGGGGIINRVSREAQWTPVRSVSLEGGSFDHRRATLDAGRGAGPAAGRIDAMYERSGGFRDGARLERWGVNPTAALMAGARTMVRVGYEHFSDDRVVDRGLPSFQGRPARAGLATFFGNPDVNTSFMHLDAAGATVQHARANGLTIRNRARFADYDKFYRNTYPGAVVATGDEVALSAYDHAIARRNLFDQTDLTFAATTGAIRHTLLAGAEFGRQRTSQRRRTGYWEDSLATIRVPLAAPTVATPVSFRQSATDADNGTTTTSAAGYLQDQLELAAWLQAIVGVRWERFDVRFADRRSPTRLRRADAMLSPRAGLVLKPVEPLSLYGGWSVSHLPSSGDQFGSLTATTSTLAPERFTNREVGAKWDATPALALTTALYRLDRTNTTAPDPLDATRVVQTGSQRTTGLELGITGAPTRRWQVAGGFASQQARVTSRTAAARAGATVPLVPHQSFSLWNRLQLLPSLGAGLGVVRQARVFAAIDDAVTLPGFTRLDGALFVSLGRHLKAQANVENLLDRRYWPTSHGNNNIMPGAPRTLRVSVQTQ